jgi:hypothetical protein
MNHAQISMHKVGEIFIVQPPIFGIESRRWSAKKKVLTML